MFWFFGHKACGIFAPHPGMEPTLTALEGKVLTTRLPEKSLSIFFFTLAPWPNVFMCEHTHTHTHTHNETSRIPKMIIPGLE